MKRTLGFTLIESIVVMVIMAIAMITLTSLLFPQIERSADPHYQTRSVALGQSLMDQILSKNFAANSGADGGAVRCGENGLVCASSSGSLTFDGIDDYQGCWYGSDITQCSDYPAEPQNELSMLFEDSYQQYKNMHVLINIELVEATSELVASDDMMKKITLTVKASRHIEFELIAYRGNY
ncbi:hypothetical protein BCU68_07255 [Vibrio sp. 10N.286.49.B3]|uniref:type IV pilus modification PilV family protein n=1 Tax=Vibrio sp. 10N.286.49.B3 TaxID=1880855 RepID=UPI000C822A14|nr:prepilin-type N-terminal cleavage/methylation domain-containing protein [Vibrio sp. 10N.286.49.B3]PMH39887.1 hypothetical protein BCU68_07255 [Vibrio sp. 10N.286.49.B3]